MAASNGFNALTVRCHVCDAAVGECCYFRSSSNIPNGEGRIHATRGIYHPDYLS